jgi:hypothetical protein
MATTKRGVLKMSPYSVYALIDPRDNQVRYIGQTRNPKSRLNDHLCVPSGTREKIDWIQELRMQGLKPQMTIIEDGLTYQESLEREQHWIQHYRGQEHEIHNHKQERKIQPDEVVNMLREYYDLLSILEPQKDADWQSAKDELQSRANALLAELGTNYHIRPFIRYQKKDA